MRSMTGFGRAEIEGGKVRVAAEVRTLNQRFFELKLNLPRTWGEHEAEIRKLVQERMNLLFSAWMTQVGHKRPGVPGGPGAKPGLPVTEATEKAADIGKRIMLLTGGK